MENAALITPRAEITEESTGENKACWVVKFEEERRKEVKTSDRSSPVVFSVAKVLLASYQEFYIPSLISGGPYHFGRPELNSMEPHKTEAVRRMEKRMHGRSMQSIIEKEIVEMDKSIREFYDKDLSYSAVELAWMVTADSCFLFEFLLKYIRTRVGKKNFLKDYVVEGTYRYDAVLSPSLANPTWGNIFDDLVLFENQITLSVLQCLLPIAQFECDPEKILGDILSSVARLEGTTVFSFGMPRPYKKQKTLHFLEVLYYRNVGWDLASYKLEAYSVEDRRSLHFGSTKSILTPCSWMWMRGRVEVLRHCFCCSRWMRGRGEALRHCFSLFARFTRCMLPPSNCVRCKCWGSLPPSNTGVKKRVPLLKVKLPSATELKKKGVNFSVATSTNSSIKQNPQPIRFVRFEQKTATLYLPEVRIDHFRHALLRNFLAMELTSLKYWPAPIRSFAFFMNELVDSEEDVAVLSEANIIKNFLGSNKEAAECFNALTKRYNWSAGCKPIDDATVGLHKYLRRKYRILWHEFISTYFEKPWLVAGSVAATLLLLMTVLQVFCLFYTCNRSS